MNAIYRLVYSLHVRDIHLLCREHRVFEGLVQPPSYVREDGSVYTPNLQSLFGPGIPTYKTWHIPRWQGRR